MKMTQIATPNRISHKRSIQHISGVFKAHFLQVIDLLHCRARRLLTMQQRYVAYKRDIGSEEHFNWWSERLICGELLVLGFWFCLRHQLLRYHLMGQMSGFLSFDFNLIELTKSSHGLWQRTICLVFFFLLKNYTNIIGFLLFSFLSIWVDGVIRWILSNWNIIRFSLFFLLIMKDILIRFMQLNYTDFREYSFLFNLMHVTRSTV